MLQIAILGLVGFVLARRKALSVEGITGLTTFLIEVTFPALIFWQIITRFNFYAFPKWWVFFSLSLVITAFGLLLGYLFSFPLRDSQVKREFICLVGFQNSGYLPLALLGWIVPKNELSNVLIYLFLFLLGFNLVIWSWGAYFLSGHKLKRFSLPSLFSPPVIATLIGFLFVMLKINSHIPKFVLSPLELLGNCSFPLAIVVVGASLAELYVVRPLDKKLLASLILTKLILMPLTGLVVLSYFRLPYFIGLLLILELAVPSATSLAVISRRYGHKEKIVSQGIFFSHLISLFSLPLFLALFNWVVFRR